MTVLGAFHRRPPLAAAAVLEPVRSALSAVVQRLADSPLDSTVLQALGGTAASRTVRPAGRTVRMRASWRTVTAADGTRHLEAHWDPAP
ncbi:hypothetical protein P3T36_007713 [Kitasatospora sp. MAP12-15]|uniref:hypothetical protein n=1 Tax=unclassified Kitasatospora TaxID=2633591 RepID=UPI0024771C90|nr:hypothetical protein [Kitasatospora sp. MAP12-44]MDH6108543.1 hypothetical protein [Kitasatospora sp. MAP12-44]